MSVEYGPIVNQWYRHLDKGYQFQVVAIDEYDKTVEIQHFDGDLEELELDTWYDLDIETIEPPEDWTGAMDDIELDDLGYTETGMSGEDWSKTLEEKGEAEKSEDPEEGEEERP